MSLDRPELAPLEAPTLVEASAGTGKTYTITTYFVRAILEYGREPEQILVLTFTNAATAELRARSRKRIVEALALLNGPPEKPDALHEVVLNAVTQLGRVEVERRLRRALGKMDQAPILTIHGFCQRLLQEHPLLFGIDFDFEVTEDASSIHTELAVDFWTSELYDKPEWFLQALQRGSVGPDYLAALANQTLLADTEILGPEPRDYDPKTMARFLESLQRAAQIWARQRDQILEVLLSTKGLHKGSYSQKSIGEKWIPGLGEFFSEARFSSPPEFFRHLAQGRMRTTKGNAEPEHEFFGACATLLDAYEELVPMLEYAVFDFKLRFIDFARDASRKRRDETSVLTYDGLLNAVYEPLRAAGPSSVRHEIIKKVSEAYPLAFIDEFQDTDSVQYGIFRAIYGDGAAIYVGDPKQAIYSFRGADVYSYIDAASDVGPRKYTLKTNRRSDPGVVQAINGLYGFRANPFLIEDIRFKPALAHEPESRTSLQPPMEVVFVSEGELKGSLAPTVAPIVANEIALLLGSGAEVEGRSVRPGDVAVLCRSNNQANAVTNALRSLNVPAALDGGSSVLETTVARDLQAVLEAALMPGDSRLIRRALLTTLLGVSPYELSSMTDEVWSEWVARFRHWHELWQGFGVLRFVEEMLRGTDAEARIANQPEARRDLSDLLHLEELLLRGEREQQKNPVALMQWFRRLSDGSGDGGGMARDELQRRPDAQSDAVRVSTIHKSKGLEYGIVYCPFTWETSSRGFTKAGVKFHDAQRNIKLDLGSANLKEHQEQEALEELSDALRLLYVAVTRAKHQCVLFWGRATGWKKAALRYLLHGDLDEKALNKLKENELRQAVEDLAAGSSGSIGCRPPRDEPAPARVEERAETTLRVRKPTRSYNHVPRIASFTSLTGHDEKMPIARPAASSTPAEAGLFEGLAGGTRTGLLLHSILEHARFDELGTVETRGLIERQLRASGFDDSLAPEVQRDLELVGSTPLTSESGAPSLSKLSNDRQLRELEFALSVDRPNLGELGKLLKRYGAPAAAPGYPERLSELSSQRLQKYLRGFIDLVFEWEGRWYVADYKSNSLPSYEPATVSEAVQREHYLLQAQLYTAAAHRYLRERLDGYEPEKHWGGAMFLFLRGMRGPGRGTESVFFERQPAELLREADSWLGGRR